MDNTPTATRNRRFALVTGLAAVTALLSALVPGAPAASGSPVAPAATTVTGAATTVTAAPTTVTGAATTVTATAAAGVAATRVTLRAVYRAATATTLPRAGICLARAEGGRYGYAAVDVRVTTTGTRVGFTRTLPVGSYTYWPCAARGGRWFAAGGPRHLRVWSPVTKILTVIEENHSLAEMRAGMPYLSSLATRYAYATGDRAVTHPSLPNYLAIAGGSTFGVTNDAGPASHRIRGSSVFGRALAAHRTATVYAEGMTSACRTRSSGRYAVRHNPWAYFTDERSLCRDHDVAMGTPTAGRLRRDIVAGRLPHAGMMVPDLCHDAHDCSLATADRWLASWLPVVLSGPDFRAGRLAIVLTADEDDRTAGNAVLTVVVHPQLHGRVVTSRLSHYSLTGWYASVLRTRRLRSAVTAPSFRAAFRL